MGQLPEPAPAQAPENVLNQVFGYRSFRPGQEEIIELLLGNRNVLAVMPTGAGKSLCYQVPALIFSQRTIVISPLIALMDDQVAALRTNGVAAAAIHSGMSREDQVAAWRGVTAGEIKILYLSPERLMTERMLKAMEKLSPAMFVVDEAHCISKWGNDFRPEYEALSQLHKRFPGTVIAGFTATADRVTREDIAGKLYGGKGEMIVHGFDRPNLFLAVASKTSWKTQLADFLKQREQQSGIIYCLSRKFTEEVTAHLKQQGRHALAYHAGHPAAQRKTSQERFMSEEAVIMVATIAFGMGIDKSDIRFVVHLNLPASMEAYYQEIGRAGRDGAAAETLLLYGLDDIRLRRMFIEEADTGTDHKRQEHKRLDALLAYCEAAHCRRRALLSYFDEIPEDCGNCDNCLTPPEVVDGSSQARSLFAAIRQSGQFFGGAHIIDILRGADTQKSRDRRHHQLAAFGAGKAHQKPYWQSFIRQAVAGGFLRINIEKFGCLEITQSGEAVLQGAESFFYKEIRDRAAAKAKKPSAKARPILNDTDTDLFTDLKMLRLELAKQKNLPAYAVFPDRALMEMAQNRPHSASQMTLISGVGPKKLEQYCEIFLARIAAFSQGI